MEYAILGGLVGAVWALLLWLSIIVWVYRDIRGRTRDLALEVLAVFVVLMFFPGFNLPGLALYLMLRPSETLEETYARSLEEEALLREIGDETECPSCRRFVEREWRACPYCQTQLKDVCGECEQLLSFSWIACPYCGTARKVAAVAEEGSAPGTVATTTGAAEPREGIRRQAAPDSGEGQQASAEGVAPYQH